MADVQLGQHVGSPTMKVGATSGSVACLSIPFLYLGYLVRPQWEKMHGSEVPGWVGILERLPFSEKKRGGMGRVGTRVGLGKKEGGDCDQAVK